MLVWQPHMVDHNLFVRMQTLGNLARLPVPEHDISRASTRRNVLAIGRKVDGASVSCHSVARKAFLLVLTEVAVRRVDEDLVVQRLARKVLVWAR